MENTIKNIVDNIGNTNMSMTPHEVSSLAIRAKCDIEMAVNDLRNELVILNPQIGLQAYSIEVSLHIKSACEILNRIADSCFGTVWDKSKNDLLEDIEQIKTETK